MSPFGIEKITWSQDTRCEYVQRRFCLSMVCYVCAFHFLLKSVGKEKITRVPDIRCQYAVYMSCVGMVVMCVFFVFPLVQGKVETSVVLVVDELGGKHNLQRFLGGTGDKSDASIRQRLFIPRPLL